VLLAAAQRCWDEAGGAKTDNNPADPYMTLVGYFNSLRELGGMRRLVEDDVRTRSAGIEERVPFDHKGPHPWAGRRGTDRARRLARSLGSTFRSPG
jgi:hypothetical protein